MAASVSPPVPGPVNDVRLARQAGVLGRLAEGDKARDRLIGRYRVVVGHPIADERPKGDTTATTSVPFRK